MKLDIFKHALVPLHEVLPESEVEEVLKTLNISRGQLPKIKANDPVVKKLEAKLGDVLKITRKSRTAGTSLYYRVVVSE